MVSISLSNYYITALTWRSEGAIETEVYEKSQESQNEAFEVIQTIIEVEGCSESSGEEDEGMSGPKRMEIALEKIGVATKIERKVVVTSCNAPNSYFPNYTVQGREWFPSKILTHDLSTYHSTEWGITRVEEHSGDASSSSLHFIPADGEKPWRRVAAFLSRLTFGESKVVENWRPNGTEFYGRSGAASYEGDDWHEHYYKTTPSTYKPAVAALRRAGDEIGAKIHLEQIERLKDCQGPRTGEGILANADAKGEEISAEAEKKSGDQLTQEVRGLLQADLCQTC